MKHTLFILALITASIQTFAQSPRIKLNQITKDSVTGSVLISSPTDSGMVYSRDLFISYGADTFLILGADTIVLQSDLIAEIGDSLVNYVSRTELSDSTSNIRTDIPLIIADSLLNYVNISGTQTITGAKTFSTDVDIDGKLDLNDGGNSIFIGNNAGFNDDGEDNSNIGIGNNSSYNNVSAIGNIGIGLESLYSNSGNRNIGIGFETLYNNTANANIAIGRSASKSNDDGTYNVSVGYQALTNNVSGDYNTAINYALPNSGGSNNTGIGYLSLSNLEIGNNNIAIGSESGRRFSGGSNNTDSRNSIFIGVDTRPADSAQSNQIVIGYDAIGLGTNTAIIGNGSLNDIYNGADNANFSTVSDARDKTNIEPLELGLNLIENLNPVAFVWDKRDSTRVGVKDIGFIAQEFDGALYALPHSDYADFVKITEDGSWKLNLSDIYPVIVKAIQEQQAIIENQSTEIETLKTLITELSNRLQILENN